MNSQEKSVTTVDELVAATKDKAPITSSFAAA